MPRSRNDFDRHDVAGMMADVRDYYDDDGDGEDEDESGGSGDSEYDSVDERGDGQWGEIDDGNGRVVVYRVLNGGDFNLADTDEEGFLEWNAHCTFATFASLTLRCFLHKRNCCTLCGLSSVTSPTLNKIPFFSHFVLSLLRAGSNITIGGEAVPPSELAKRLLIYTASRVDRTIGNGVQSMFDLDGGDWADRVMFAAGYQPPGGYQPPVLHYGSSPIFGISYPPSPTQVAGV